MHNELPGIVSWSKMHQVPRKAAWRGPATCPHPWEERPQCWSQGYMKEDRKPGERWYLFKLLAKGKELSIRKH